MRPLAVPNDVAEIIEAFAHKITQDALPQHSRPGPVFYPSKHVLCQYWCFSRDSEYMKKGMEEKALADAEAQGLQVFEYRHIRDRTARALGGQADAAAFIMLFLAKDVEDLRDRMAVLQIMTC